MAVEVDLAPRVLLYAQAATIEALDQNDVVRGTYDSFLSLSRLLLPQASQLLFLGRQLCLLHRHLLLQSCILCTIMVKTSQDRACDGPLSAFILSDIDSLSHSSLSPSSKSYS
eukprot:SAG31_NODE_3485_length_4211_cov_2.074903_6_plen_113_part_00